MAKKRKKNRARKKSSVNRPVQPATAKKAGKPYKTAALVLGMLVCVALAAWFGLSPAIEQNRMLEQQSALLDSIENGDGVIVLEETLAAATVDFYDGNGGDAPALDTLPESGTVGTEEQDNPQPLEPSAPVDTAVTGIGVLTIDTIDLTLPVTEGVSETQLKVAVGHVPQTAAIGDIGSAVIAGHRSYAYGQFFNRLGELAVGDVIRYQPKDGETMEFEVYEILEVQPGDPAAFEQPDDQQTLTLYTCTPIQTATHRLLVRAVRTV